MRLPIVVVAACLAAAFVSPAVAQSFSVPAAGEQWRDVPALAPTVTDPVQRQQMNAEIAQAIRDADGDEGAARQAISRIVARFEEAAQAQNARSRPGPGSSKPNR